MCRECGKPKCGCHDNPCGLSPSVLQINNHRGCVLFEAVDIPASAGDDSEGSPYAPVNGKFKNTLVTYEANGNMYFYTSSGVFKKISSIGDLSKYATIKYSDEKDAETLTSAKEYTDEIADGKVDKEEGKGLSTNDYTNWDKEKLNSLGKTLTIRGNEETVTYNGTQNVEIEISHLDPSLYYTKTETDTLLSAKQSRLTAGANITISDDTIAASDTPIGGIKLVANRGAQFNAPGNTIPAFEIAGQQGFYGIEFDVQRTSDGEFVVMNDRSVDSTTDGTGNVDEMTLAEIEALTIDAGTDIDVYPNLKVPTLDQALKTIRRSNSIPFIEIKADTIDVGDIQEVIDAVNGNGLIDRVEFISLSEALATEVKRIVPSANVWLAYRTATRAAIDKCAENGFGLDSGAWTPELVAYANSKNVAVGGYAISNNAQYIASKNLGIEFITTNGIEYCRDSTPAYVGELGVKAYSEYEKECVFANRIINRHLPGTGAQTDFDLVVNNFNTGWNDMERGFFPRVYSLNGATSISYDFEDSRYDDVDITFRFFNAQHQQLRDINWLSHSAKTFSDIPAGAVYFIIYCAGRSGTLKEYDRTLLNEMARTISLSGQSGIPSGYTEIEISKTDANNNTTTVHVLGRVG